MSNRNFVEVKEIEREVNYYGAIDSRPIKESDIKMNIKMSCQLLFQRRLYIELLGPECILKQY